MANDNIVIAGENGTGKLTILNIVFEFSKYKLINTASSEIRVFEIELNSIEANLLITNTTTSRTFTTGIQSNIIEIKWDLSIQGHWDQIILGWTDSAGVTKTTNGSIFSNNDIKPIFKSIFSDVEINYAPNNIKSPTSKDIDIDFKASEKSGRDLATEITQLLIDIKSSDNDDIAHWVESNPGLTPPHTLMDNRLKRFRDAFHYMFPHKTLDRVDKVNESRKIIFKENGKEMFIEDLSSGEKQIVFRGSFLMKNKGTNQNTVILIDEPEISMHPKWQRVIVEFYQKLFTSATGTQESQIFLLHILSSFYHLH